jgi:hypothetical protein
MDNVQILLYVIIGIVYLISKLSKRSKDPDGSADQETTNRPVRRESSTNRPSASPALGPTFEELLREISEAKRSQTVDHQKDSAPAYASNDGLKEQEKSVHYYDDDHISKVYEDAKKEAFNRPSLEETMLQQSKTIENNLSERKSKAVSSAPSVLEMYLEEMRDPEGFKKAVVMSEILQRKF